MSGEVRTWEYLTLAGERPDDELSALGRAGWELVGVGGGPGGTRLYFKRRGLDFRERVTLDQKRRYYALWGLPSGDDGESG